MQVVGIRPVGLQEVAWQNALLPWVIMATVFYTGVLFNFWRAARSGKLEPSPRVLKIRTQWWPVVAFATGAALFVLYLVITKAYDHSRWPMRHGGMSKALWIGLIPVVSVVSASCASLLLFVRPGGDGASATGATGTYDASAPATGAPPDSAGSAGAPCVRCQAQTQWHDSYQRFRCVDCGVYQPTGPKAS